MARTRRWRATVLLPFLLSLSAVTAAPVAAANGDNLRTIIADRTGTSCASVNAAGNHGSVGVGIAFDGTNLLISCYDNNVTAINPANGAQVANHAITGAASLGALAWDNGRGKLWACSASNDVGLIDPATWAFSVAFSSQGCFDGLAYDASDDTIYSSADVSSHVEHYSVSGALLSTSPISLGGTSANSGIAVGGTNLYLANNGHSQIYEVPKNFSSETLFATFPSRLEDLECDNITFGGGLNPKAAIWSIDAYDNILNAWEIPNGACLFGGGGTEPTEHPGTIPGPFACGTYVRGGFASGYQTNPATYDYLTPSPLGLSGAGNLADHHWVQSYASPDFIVMDMGAAVPAVFLVPSIDHGPVPGEAMESTLYGTNNPLAPEGTWEAGAITDIYLQGVDPAWISDDYATRWTFSTSYRYIGIIHGGPAAIVDDGDAEIDAICTPRTNTPPTANARGPYAGNEGSAIAISGTASDPDAGDTVTTTWSYTNGAGVDPGATCSFANANALSTTVTCTDDGTYILTLTASDGVNPPVTSAPTNLVVANVAPIVTIASPTDGALYAIGTPVVLSAPFTDAGANDTHTCTVNWDDGAGAVGATVTEVPGSGTCSSSKTYTAAGVYTITVAVTDDDLDVGTASVMIIVYDPTAGFVTGGGWINSPAGAYVPDPTLTGKANFGFVSKYKKGASAPTGETEFQFHAGSFNFHSEAYQWLVVAGCKAQYKGTGMVNGVTGYGFLLTATDGDSCASKTTDKFRIKVWLVSTKAIVYDNKMGASDDIDAANPQAIAGGQIVIHK